MFRPLFLLLVLLAIMAMACGFSVDLPQAPTPGPEVTDEILVEVPESDQVNLMLTFGAGKLDLAPGAEDALVTGTATYNISDFEPKINTSDGKVEIVQGEYRLKSINLSEYKNEWQLKLGTTPMELNINAGAYEGNFELGGLALTDLTVKDGAADVDLAFSEPNQTEMSVLRYETGASDVQLTGLANANFSAMVFKGGAGNFHLDFNGELQRDATVTLECGLSDLQLIIPEGLNAKVTVEGAAVNVNHSSGWSQSNSTYLQDAPGPILTVIVKMSAGNVTITD